jgi:signal transduction histidine kinase
MASTSELSMDRAPAAFVRYQELQSYVGWTNDDARRVRAAATIAAGCFDGLVEDFYSEIDKHPEARRVITGGAAQVERLKQTLRGWLEDLFRGPYDLEYVARRWRVGLRHVELGLPHLYTAAAVSRLRSRLMAAVAGGWSGDRASLVETTTSLDRLIDLDLAVIGDAYETENIRRRQEAERIRLGDVLHREKELSAGLFNHAQAAVLVLDRSGVVVRCNPFAEALAGEGPESEASDLQAETEARGAEVGAAKGRAANGSTPSLEGRSWCDEFLDASARDAVRKALLGSVPATKPTVVSTKLVRGGRTRNLQWTVSRLCDAGGTPFGVLVIGHDVTELIEAQARALQAGRLAAIGEMATGLAHESRNALQRIGAAAEMLELELEGNTRLLEHVSRIQQSQNHLHLLLEEVRNYAAPVVLDRSPCRISEVWREAWELLRGARMKRTCELGEKIRVNDLGIEADRFRLVQVFRNLLDNGLAAASDPARIEITCDDARIGGAAAFRVAVVDNGPGLTAEQRRRIFEPFYTTKPTGTGLGTAIAQRLVEAHGGTISVGERAGAGKGTEIVVVLPRWKPV